MSPSSGYTSRTPNPRSNSFNLLASLKAIASSRPENEASPSPSPASSGPGDARTALREYQLRAGEKSKRRPSQTRIQRTRVSKKTAPSGNGRLLDGVPILGAPSDLQSLLQQLHASQDLDEHIDTAKCICAILQDYRISHYAGVWSAAQDYMEHAQSAEAQQAGYEILKACVTFARLVPLEQRMFFKSLIRGYALKNIEQRLFLLEILLKKGKNVEGFEDLVAPLFSELLKAIHQAVVSARKNADSKVDSSVDVENNFARICQLVSGLIKFNSKAFKKDDLEMLLSEFLNVCSSPGSESEVKDSLFVVDGFVTYAYMPTESTKSCLEVLCGLHWGVPNLREQTWEIVLHLLGSHLGQRSVGEMINILRLPADTEVIKRVPSQAAGAVQVLRRLLALGGVGTFDRVASLPDIPMNALILALGESLVIDSRTYQLEVMALLSEIFSKPNLVDRLLEEEGWNGFVGIVSKCAQKSAKRFGDGQDCDEDDSSASLVDRAEDTQSNQPQAPYVGFLDRLAALSKELDFVQRFALMDMFSHLSKQLSNSAAESLVEYHVQERLLYPSDQEWLRCSQRLLNALLKGSNRPTHIRGTILNAFVSAFEIISRLCPPSDAYKFTTMIIDCMRYEEEPVIFQALADFCLNVAGLCSDDYFITILRTLLGAASTSANSTPEATTSPGASTDAPPPFANVPISESIPNIAARTIVRLFIRSMNISAERARNLFDTLVQIASSERYESAARITCLKLLFRLRSDANQAIFLIASTESQRLAASLCRTVETSLSQETPEQTTVDTSSKVEGPGITRLARTKSTKANSTTKQATRPTGPNKLARPTAPLWLYPGPKGLPEEPPSGSSPLLFSMLKTGESQGSRQPLNLKIWLEAVVAMMQRGTEWEVYSYILVHLGAQLANQSLFADAAPEVRALRSVLCEQLRNASFYEPPGFTNVRKGDVAVCLYNIVTMLVSYHLRFTKSEQDEIVASLVLGIVTWDRTWRTCVHALTVCCHELPASVAAHIGKILHRLSQLITQSHMAEHVLEFLAGLARLPNLYKDFVYEEFKQVFAICFRYLGYMRDQREDRMTSSVMSSSQILGSNISVAQGSKAPAEADRGPERGRSSTEELPQYVYALTYHVMVFWYMALRLQDRPKLIPFVTKGLMYTDKTGEQVVEDQAQVTIEMVQRVAYSDRDETAPDPAFAKRSDGIINKKTWLSGLSLLTIETAGRTGVSQVTERTPSATSYSTYTPQLTAPPRHQIPITVGSAADAYFTPDYIGILPDAIFFKLYGPLMIPPLSAAFDQPVELPCDEITERAIASFDRNVPVDGHKIGVIYIGEGQTREAEILANVNGSQDYYALLEGLGTLIRLGGAKFNTQGLDRESDADGEVTFAWRDRVTEIVFHITTMMPTNLEYDPQCTAKKRHTGNDFVNIIWNDSGAPFNFDTFPSDFNYVNIVISPEARTSFIQTRLRADADGHDRFYKVQTLSKPGFPEISPAADTKIISGKGLPTFVRLLALNASVFSLAWANREGGEHVSSWRNRLLEIKHLRERYVPKAPASEDGPQSPVLMAQRPGSASQLSLVDRTGIRDSVVTKRTSGLTFASENRSSVWSLAPEMERQSSESSRG